MLNKLKKIKHYLTEKVEFKRYELVKYYIASLFMFIPALVTFFHYFRINSLFCFIALTSLCFSILISFKVNRWITLPFVLLAISCAAYHIVIGQPIGFQTLAAMYETNISESIGFLGSPMAIPLILGASIAAVVFVWLVVSQKPLPKLKKGTSVRRKFLLPLIIVSLLLFLIPGSNLLEEYPVNLFYDNYRYLDEKQEGKKYLITEYKYKPDSNFKNKNGEVFVLIIGEAGRRASLSAYGYEKETSPFLDRFNKEHPENVTIFKDAVSASAYTRATVLPILSPLNIEEIDMILSKPSLSKIFKGAGCDTLYVTTRPEYPRRNTVSIFQDDAEKVYYLSSLRDKKYDEATLPVINNFINKTGTKKLIILHLMGSHINYQFQYPKEFKFFNSGDPWLDAYNDTIRYSDYIIQQVVDIVMAYDKPGIVLYASDHGENLNDFGDENFGHGTRELTKFELEIPFIVYFNDSFLSQHDKQAGNIRSLNNRRISQDNISHTFLGLSEIKDHDFYRNYQDLSSESFKEQRRFVSDENMNFYDYDKMKFPQIKKQ
jgi:heptose-I-phosphate ethanolaminephosphotransferase